MEGYLKANYQLGQIYLQGLGVQADETKAAKFYKLAAENDYVRAQYRLGRLYHKGMGVDRDEKTAYDWFRKAAKQGYSKAQCATAIHLAKGLGVTKDYVQAYAWMLLANKSQNSQIKDFLFKISEKLTEYQIIEARTLADKWYGEQHRLTTASE